MQFHTVAMACPSVHGPSHLSAHLPLTLDFVSLFNLLPLFLALFNSFCIGWLIRMEREHVQQWNNPCLVLKILLRALLLTCGDCCRVPRVGGFCVVQNSQLVTTER